VEPRLARKDTRMLSQQEVREAAERYLQAVAKRDVEGVVKLFSPTAVQRDPVTAPPNEGHDAIRSFFENAIGGSDTWTVQVHRVLACGQSAAVSFTLTVEVGGAGMEMDVIEVIEIADDGLIERLDAYWDTDLIRAIPAPQQSP